MLQRSLKEEVKHYYKYGGSIAKIIVIAVVVFVLQLLVWFIGDLVLKTGLGTLVINLSNNHGVFLPISGCIKTRFT